jgi:copper transport protein
VGNGGGGAGARLFAGILMLTGIFAALLHSSSLGALIGSEYGRWLFIKLGVFLLVLIAGAFNFRRILPDLGSDAATSRLRCSAGFELVAGAVVLLITAVLVATARPYEEPLPEAHRLVPATDLSWNTGDTRLR